MKTNTYLRLSLLIPILVWILCLVVFVLLSLTLLPDPELDQPFTVVGVLVAFTGIYVFGIILWIVPYLLLSLILFFSSFIGSPRVMITLYAFSPLAMTLLTLALMNIYLFAYVGASAFPDMPISSLQGYGTSMLAMGGIVVLSGYICVCVGYGIYKLLKSRGVIRDERALEPVPHPV